jgi:glycosyltransferase involved in cell wall biosynthesis
MFLVRSLDAGGAERQLIELVKHLDRSQIQAVIVTFYEGGLLRSELENDKDISLYCLGKGGRWELLRFFDRLIKLIKLEKPDLIHGYLDVPNLFALLAGRLTGCKVIWGLRASQRDLSSYDWTVGVIYRLTKWLSFWPDCIIVNSHAGKTFHVNQGYYSKRMKVISNGIDTKRFYPDVESGIKYRHQFNIIDKDVLIGQVGRLDPRKDPENFLRAAAILIQNHPELRFIYIGDGPPPYRELLKTLSKELGISEKLIWTGTISDMRTVYNALDVLSLSSSTEGFPNVVGEAMACSIPCVVTSVGDATWIVGDEGIVVPPENSSALADGLEQMIIMSVESRKAMGARARARVETCFEVNALADRTGQLFMDLFSESK